MTKIELLSPAGNMDALIAAVQAGADAIYLGGILFSARAFAGNFTNDEIKEAINYCHLYGVKVYVTCNILIYEHEVEKFLNYIDFLHQNNVDAIIIQDLGMLDLVHKIFPNLEIHASTQMHIHNLDGVMLAQKLGCKRVVLARETPIEKVREIINNSSCDIEIFAHGSLCVSYSGECLFSSLIGNRSGNRGSCVGSCRLPYKIVDELGNKLNSGDYPLSMKDLNTIAYIGKLIETGITSLKIEGRMKSKEYVYTVTKLYRMAIDSYYEKKEVEINTKLLDDLKRIYARSYTKGYLFNEKMEDILANDRPNHQGVYIGKVIKYHHGYVDIKLIDDISINDGIRIIQDDEDYGLILNEFYINKKLVKEAHKNDIISFKVNKKIMINKMVFLTKDDSLIKSIEDTIKSKPRKVLVDVKIQISLNNIIFKINDGKNIVEMQDNFPTKALKKATTKEEIQEKINKIGDTIYKINNLEIILDDNLFIPFNKLNELRRSAFLELDKKRCYKIDYQKGEYNIVLEDYPHKELKSVLVNQNRKNLNFDIIYSENYHDNCIIKLPKVMESYDHLDINKEYLVGEIGALNKLKYVYSDYSFNVVNSYTVALLHSLKVQRITLSLELSHKQIENLYNAYVKRYYKKPNLEVIVSAYREVMTLKTKLNEIYKKNNLFLVDKYGNKYKIRAYNNLNYLYEPKKYIDNFNYYQIGINVLRNNEEV